MNEVQNETNQNMVVFFPEDVIIHILLQLPSKSLVRSRCVSKYWNTIITSPSFIKAHLHKSSKLCHLLCQEDLDNRNVLKLKMLFSGNSKFSNIDPPPAVTDGFKMVDSSNGIVCLYTTNHRVSTSRIWLWNPAINDCFVIPEPRFPILSAKRYCVGFWFNPLRSHLGDFKVVSVTQYYKGYFPDTMWLNFWSRVEIYSRKTNSWKEHVGWIPKWSSYDITGNQVIYEEYICWSPYHRTWSGDGSHYTKKAIVSFNVISEEFHEMALPDSIPSYEWGCITLLGGCVSLLVPTSVGHEVWTMKEFGNIKSWSKLYSINVLPKECCNYHTHGSSGIVCRPLGFSSTDEALFWRCSYNCVRYRHSSSNSILVADTTRTRTADRIETISLGAVSTNIDCYLKLYKESLVPVSYSLSQVWVLTLPERPNQAASNHPEA